MSLRVGSLFAGIGGFDLGFERAGMQTAWQVEIDPKCRELLARRFPGAVQYEDVTKCGAHNLAPVDVICGGFPCQDLSVAGKRAGLAGARSGLFYEMARIVDELKPAWLVWENVPGLLSSHRGADFASVLVELERIGYLGAWTTLDARYFGVAQRRRRIFGVFARGDSGAERAAEVLALAARLRGNPAPGGTKGEGIAHTLGTRSADGRNERGDGSGNLQVTAEALAMRGRGGSTMAELGGDVANAIRTPSGGRSGEGVGAVLVTPALQAGSPTYERGDGSLFCVPRDWPAEIAPTLNCAYGDKMGLEDQHALNGAGHFVPTLRVGGRDQGAGDSYDNTPIVAQPVRSNPHNNSDPTTEARMHIQQSSGVRRLTPTECERLQGFPDDWTAGFSDTHRYRMLGNAVAVPCAAWIGRRLVSHA